jgi:hypothetical protein
MVATSVNAARGAEALRRITAHVEEHGTTEQLDRLNRITGGRAPAPNKQPVEFSVYLAEALAIALELHDEHLEESKPRPRGRPKKRAEAA